MYDLGNSPEEEAIIQNMLNDFEVEGVFVPTIRAEYHGRESSAIIMEKLDAVNLQLALIGEEEMPASFSLDDFSDRLEKYVSAMHQKKGIVHKDLEARNVMVDRKTGFPRVIDFGRSKTRDQQDQREFMIAARGDKDNLAKIKSRLDDCFGKNN